MSGSAPRSPAPPAPSLGVTRSGDRFATGPRGTGARLDGVSNTRARIVGDRTGLLADAIVLAVRLGRALRRTTVAGAVLLASVVTALGWVIVVSTPVFFILVYALSWAEMLIVAWTAVALLVVASLSLIRPLSIRVTAELAHPRVTVGDDVEVQLAVRNLRRRRVLGNRLELRVGAGAVELVVPALRRSGHHSQSVTIPTHRRGVLMVGPVRAIRADPIGLVRRELELSESQRLTIHPRTIGVPSSSGGLIRDLEGTPTRDLTDSDIAFHALRDYVPGDDRRYIHWKSSARTGTFMVRQFEQTRRSNLLVALSLSRGDYASDDEFELAVSAGASVGVRAIRDARFVEVLVSATTPEFAKRSVIDARSLATVTSARLLDDLAAVEMSESAIGVRDLASVAAKGRERASLVFLVSGSLPSLTQLRASAHAFGPGVDVVIVVCSPDAPPGARVLGGVVVLSIGFLEDLRSLLARSAALA